MRVFLLSLVAFFGAIAPKSAAASQFVLNLAGDHKVTVSVAPQDLSFLMINRLPTGTYMVSVVSKITVVPNLGDLKLAPGGFASAECDAIAVEVDKLNKATDEKQVALLFQGLRTLITNGKCTDDTIVQAGNLALSRTVAVIEGSYSVSYGVTVLVTITRGSETWEFVFDGGSRGEWLATYGLSIAEADDQGYFAKSAGSSKFVVTPQRVADEHELDLIPAVYYTWLPRRWSNQDFSGGITAGLGVTDSSPGIFIGGSLLYNWNLQLAAGLSISKQLRLDETYSPDQELTEFIAPDKLNRGVFKASLGFAVSFRFGGNPFAKAEGGEAGAKPDPKASDAAKKADGKD